MTIRIRLYSCAIETVNWNIKLTYVSPIESAFRKLKDSSVALLTFVTKKHGDADQTENAAGKINDWASLLNNAVWSGGLIVAIQAIKTASNISGFNWFCVIVLQVLLGATTLSLGFAAVFVAIDRVGQKLSGGLRIVVSVAIVAIFALSAWGLAVAVIELMLSSPSEAAATQSSVTN